MTQIPTSLDQLKQEMFKKEEEAKARGLPFN
jgi:hypothetical protein